MLSPPVVRAAARMRIAADDEDGAEDRGPADETNEAEGAEVEDVDDFVAESVPLQSSSASAAAVTAVPEFVNPLEKEARKSLAGGEEWWTMIAPHGTAGTTLHLTFKPRNAGDRDNAFFSHMRAAAEARKHAEEEKLRVSVADDCECGCSMKRVLLQGRLAAMTPEERAEYERERANEERREARKSRSE